VKILKIEIENYKKIKIFEVELGGKNLALSGDTGAGKTTAISALWDIIRNVGDPLRHGEQKGRIKITLGDTKKKVFCEKKFTPKTQATIIITSEGEKISVKDFRDWFSQLGTNPHKFLELPTKEQTEILLNSVELPDNINLEELNQEIIKNGGRS